MNLRRLTAFLLTTLAFTTTAPSLRAQMHHVDAPEQVTRAVAVYEWTGDLKKPTAARLVPVTVFLDGHMENGGTFLAQPVPFALSIGNIYSIEKAGDPFGTLELNLARNMAARHDDDDAPIGGSWYGYGKFQPPAPPKKSNLKPTTKPITISGSEDDDKPHFVPSRNTGDTTDKTATPGSTDRGATEDTDRPALRRSPGAAPQTIPDDDDPDKPTLGHRDDKPADPKAKKPKKEKPGGYVTPVAGSLNDDPDRPTIRRGPKPDDEVPPLNGTPAGLHQAIAVSDPVAQEDHDFARAWDGADDRDKTLAAMQALALPLVRQYLVTNALTPAAALPPDPQTAAPPPPAAATTPTTDDPTPPKLARTPNGISTATVHNDTPPPPALNSVHNTMKRKAGKPAPMVPLAPVFADEQLSGYELSYGGLPTFVYSAKVPAATLKLPLMTPVVYVTVVAQRLPSGTLSTSLTSVTDSAHMDRVPWLRFIDVVDADGSHRASLLFELRAQHTRQFGLYRLISATADQTFLTSSLE